MNNLNAWANNPYMIGWDTFFPKLESLAKTNSTSFPPYNVRKVDDNNFIIELAVAGYNKSNLTVTEENCCVTVEGELPETNDEYLHKGIAGRKFTRTFSLAEHMYADGLHLVDGMLLIKIKREIPEEKKPKTLTIEEPLLNGKKSFNDELKKISHKTRL
jgi:molecular chaperone IbpA